MNEETRFLAAVLRDLAASTAVILAALRAPCAATLPIQARLLTTASASASLLRP